MDVSGVADDGMFQFEINTESAASSSKVPDQDENEEKVDVMLDQLLQWLRSFGGATIGLDSISINGSMEHNFTSLSSSSTLSQQELDTFAPLLEDIFKILLGVFDRHLLTTNQTKYAQWALFYMCSLREEFVTRLFDHLFDIVQNHKFPQQQRQRACMYIASLTSRATYVKETMTQMVLNHMCNWMTSYIEVQEENGLAPDANHHMLFYAMFHGITYILRALHESLFDRPSAKHTIQELGLLVIVRSGLNPLKVCSPALVYSFIDVMAKYGVTFTNVIQHNEKLILPAKDVFGPNSLLTDFFPFDPYLLRRSGAHIIPMYHYPEQYSKFSRSGTFESGYATEGETEMDMDLRQTTDDHEDMDDEDAHTTESMLAMMDFGRGSMPTPNNPNKSLTGSGGIGAASPASSGVFGSFDEKSSLASSGHNSNSFSHSGSFMAAPSFGAGANGGSPAAFGIAHNPFSTGLSPSRHSPSHLNHSHIDAFAQHGDMGQTHNTPANESSMAASFAVGSLTEPRRNFAKRSRDDSWQPSTPASAALFSPAPQRSFSHITGSTTTTGTGARSWGDAQSSVPVISTTEP